MLSHLNALAFVDWAADEFEVTEADRLSSHAPLHFDLSVFDLFAAARTGAAVVLVPGQLSLFPVALARWIRDAGITVWYSVPSILTLLVLRGKLTETKLPDLRTILFAGEVFPTKYLHALM
jgi:non-ribosomal peptide synthetase component F